MEPVRSAAELYAHAIAIEREAAERYAEFAQRMNDLGDAAVAAVFARLARLEEEHLGAPETAARELVYRLMTPRNALAIALGAKKRAHVAMIEDLLARTPGAVVDWASVYQTN